MMTIDQINYFIELANCRTISQAATNLHISQAGLSRSISQLETELGFALFTRSRQGSLLTAKGKQFLQYAEQLLATYRATQMAAKGIANSQRKEARIAVCCYFAAINQQFIKMQKDGCHFSLRMNEIPSARIIELVKNGIYDLGLIAINSTAQNELAELKIKLVTHGHLRLYVPIDSPFAQIKHLQIADLKKMKFVLYEDEYNERLFNLLQLKTGPLNVIFHGGSDWTTDQIANELNACFVGRDFQFQYSGKKLRKAFTGLNLSKFINDQFDLVWICRPNYRLDDIDRAFLNVDVTRFK